MGLEIIFLYDDYGIERIFGNCLKEDISSSRMLDTLISNVGGGIKHVEVPMPPPILSEDEVRANL